jgi:hypothetical protein
MNTEVAIIFTVGSIAGTILITQMWQMNWFKKENFKFQKANVMAENKIKLKKLEREMGLDTPKGTSFNEKGGLNDIIKGLDRDKIEGILDTLGGGKDEYIEEEPSELEKILKMLPPSVIEGFVSQLTKKHNIDEETLFNK